MLSNGWWIVKEAAQKYFSNGYIWLLFLIALVWIMVKKSKNKASIFLAIYCVIYAIVVLNPISAVVLTKLGLDLVYWRVFWLMPVGILLCYLLVTIVECVKKRWMKNIIIILECVLLAICGGWIYTKDNFKIAQSPYKIPQYVLEVEALIPDGSTIMGDDYVVIWIRTLNATINMPYGRQMIWNGGSEEQMELHSLLNQEILDVKVLSQKALQYNCDYVVIDKTKQLSDKWENYGMTLEGETPYYYIYRVGQNRVYITQYGDDSGSQGQFYTITSAKGELIIIDGGNPGNADQVRRVIAENGNHVNTWILTHPHPDHIGAFNLIWQQPEDIQIDSVYAIDLNYDNYKALAQPWDDFSQFELFNQLMQNEERLHYVHTGDEWELAGLKIQVLNAYDSLVTDQYTTDLANDGSMMFKVTNKEESMLFCADVGVNMSDEIMSHYAEELSSDYIQMGHHGNGGLSSEFYQKVHPKVAFFDAPEWLMHPEDDSHGWTTPQNSELMESMGAEVYYYATAPNQIELK